ncbi:MAG: hypothetical protein B7733_16265 [Myxococcales bacterium FL481]|nr:MAG: hypothetical protein B7733_16265 [Myxococcales bacterium FL481]
MPDDAATPGRGHPRTIARAVVFLLLTSWMMAGPFFRHELQSHNPHLPKWRMFRGKGTGIVDARFYIENDDGTRERIDRFATMGVDNVFGLSHLKRLIRSKRELATQTRRLCRRLGPGTKLYVVARQGRADGWREIDDGTSDRCSKPASPRKRGSKRS